MLLDRLFRIQRSYINLVGKIEQLLRQVLLQLQPLPPMRWLWERQNRQLHVMPKMWVEVFIDGRGGTDDLVNVDSDLY